MVFDLTPGSRYARRHYLLAASAAGSSPGIPVSPQARIPLNPDLVLQFTINVANSSILPGSAGTLDATGKAQARLVAPPGMLSVLQGCSLTFAFALLGPLDFASNPVVLQVLP